MTDSWPEPTEPEQATTDPREQDGRFLPELEVDDLGRQRRLTVAFRLLLLVPHFVVLYGLTIAAEVVAFLGWFAALVKGRLPDWAAEFLGGYVAWSARVQASAYLLVDQYPPFAWAPADAVARVELHPGRLNRWAVFFRFLLVIPAAVVSTLATLGWGVAALVIWLIVLILGRQPRALFAATAAVLRYQVRYQSWFLMLTSAYPRGLFGDRAPIAAPTTPQQPGTAEQPVGQQLADPSQQPIEQPIAQVDVPTEPVRTRPLLLTGAARGLVILFLVLGVLYYAGIGITVGLVAAHSADRSDAVHRTETAYNSFNRAVRTAGANLSGCSDRDCVVAQFRAIETHADALDDAVDEIDYPGDVEAAAERLQDDADAVSDAAEQLQGVTTPQQLQSLLASTGLQAKLDAANRDVHSLVDQLTQ